MSKLYVTEYQSLPRIEGSGIVPIADEESFISTTVVDFSGGHAEITLNALTKYVELNNDAICSLAYGSAPVATTSDKRLPADTLMYRGVKGGKKFSVTANT